MGAKYTEAQARATKAYEERTYKSVLFRFRLDEDADIIEDYDLAVSHGIRKIDWFREMFDNGGLSTAKVERAMRRHGVTEEVITAVINDLKGK